MVTRAEGRKWTKETAVARNTSYKRMPRSVVVDPAQPAVDRGDDLGLPEAELPDITTTTAAVVVAAVDPGRVFRVYLCSFLGWGRPGKEKELDREGRGERLAGLQACWRTAHGRTAHTRPSRDFVFFLLSHNPRATSAAQHAPPPAGLCVPPVVPSPPRGARAAVAVFLGLLTPPALDKFSAVPANPVARD